jgi:hypothetical protein
VEYDNGEIELEEFFEQDEGSVVLFTENSRQISIAFIFERIHEGVRDSAAKPWHGRGGIIPQIQKVLDLGNRKMQSEETILGRHPFLEHASVEAQIIADSQEDGARIQHSHFVVNTYRQEQGLISLTKSAVYGLIL